MPIAPVFPAPGSGGGGGGGDSIVTPPAATTQAVSSGGSPSAKTFGAFTDPDGVIDNYNATMVNAVGSTSASGTGLGAYTFSGSSDGDSFTLKLDARNSSNEILATAVHTVNIASAGDTALDPNANTASVPAISQTDATSGTTIGTVSFTGPSPAAGATLGGADAASFNLSGGSNGTVTVTAASNLTSGSGSGAGGNYDFTLTVNNEGGSGYTTSTLSLNVTPPISSLVQVMSNDGYLVHRYADGSWAAYDVFGIGMNLRLLFNAADFFHDPAIQQVSPVARFDQTTGNDAWWSDDPTDDSFAGAQNFYGNNASVQSMHVDSYNGYIIFGFNNGRIRYKTLADVITGDLASTVEVQLGWSGGGSENVLGLMTNNSTGTNYVTGYSNSGVGVAHLSRCPGAPNGTWTEQTTGLSAGGIWGGDFDGNTVVFAGASNDDFGASRDGKIIWSDDDGATWNVNSFSGSGGFRDIAYDQSGVWVAVGGGGTIYSSTDPTSGTWTARTSGTSNELYGVAWDSTAGEFVAVGANKTMLSSSNGTSWSAITVPSGPGSSASFLSVCSNGYPAV